MANEVKVAFEDGHTIYVLVRDDAGQIYDVGDDALEAVGTWNDARADECDIALTAKDAELYLGNFPNLANGTYIVEAYIQAGANPDTDDEFIGGEELVWDGSTAVLISMHHYMSM